MNICPQCGLMWGDCRCVSWPLKYIKFARPQVFWILQNNSTIPEGTPGFSPEELGGRNLKSPFEAASCVIAEIEARIEACGEAGETLVYEAPRAQRKPATALLREYYDGLSPAARRALNYCSGWRRRRQTFAEWKRDQRKNHKFVVAK